MYKLKDFVNVCETWNRSSIFWTKRRVSVFWTSLQNRPKIERIDPKALFRAFRFRPNAPAVRAQIFGRSQVDREEVPCQVSSSHHLWLAQNQARNVLSGPLFELFLRGFTPDVRGEIRCDRTLVSGHHSPKISKPWHNYWRRDAQKTFRLSEWTTFLEIF